MHRHIFRFSITCHTNYFHSDSLDRSILIVSNLIWLYSLENSIRRDIQLSWSWSWSTFDFQIKWKQFPCHSRSIYYSVVTILYEVSYMKEIIDGRISFYHLHWNNKRLIMVYIEFANVFRFFVTRFLDNFHHVSILWLPGYFFICTTNAIKVFQQILTREKIRSSTTKSIYRLIESQNRLRNYRQENILFS